MNESAEEYIEDDALANNMIEDIAPDDEIIGIQNASEKSLILVQWIILFLLTLQSAYQLSSAALNCAIKFFKQLFTVLSYSSPEMTDLAQAFPTTYHVCCKKFVSQIKFSRFVVCRKCYSLYTLKDCLVGHEHNQKSKICQFKAYPNHPHERMRQSCQTTLLKTVELASGKTFFYPVLMYCYVGIQNSLQRSNKISQNSVKSGEIIVEIRIVIGMYMMEMYGKSSWMLTESHSFHCPIIWLCN